jgi:hypothetical protein
MKDRLLALVLALLLVGLIVVVIMGYAQELFAVPLLYALWLLRLLYESIPQQLFWIAALALVALVVGRSMFRLRPSTPRPAPARPQSTPVAAWAALIGESTRDDYSRWLLAQRLAALAGSALADREPGSPRLLWQILADPAIEIPPDVRAYLVAGMSVTMNSGPRRSLQAWLRMDTSQAATPLDLDPALVVKWLEHELNGAIKEPS